MAGNEQEENRDFAVSGLLPGKISRYDGRGEAFSGRPLLWPDFNVARAQDFKDFAPVVAPGLQTEGIPRLAQSKLGFPAPDGGRGKLKSVGNFFES